MKSFFSWSIRTHLLILVTMALLPALGIILYSGLENRSRAIKDAEKKVLQLEQSLAENQLRNVDRTRQLLMTLAKLPIIRNRSVEECNTLLRDLLKQNPCLSNILVADRNGTVFASALPFTKLNVADRGYFQGALQRRDFAVGDYTISRTAQKPAIHFAYPVLSEKRLSHGVVIAAFELSYYGRLFSQAKLPDGSALTLTDSQGTRIYRYPDTKKYFGVPDLPEMQQRMSGPAREGTFTASGVDGIIRLYAFQRLQLLTPSANFYIRVGIPADAVVASAQASLSRNLMLMGIAAIMALFFTWLLGELFFVRRLTTLVTASRRIGRGSLDTRSGLPHAGGEIGQLAKSFDEMAAALELREKERSEADAALMESEKRLTRVLQGSMDGFWDWDMKTREVRHSDRWAEMLGYRPDEIEQHVRSWKSLVHPDDLPRVMIVFKEHLTGRRSQYQIEYRMRCKSGEWRWILDRGKVVEWDENGEAFRMSGTATDITDKKQMELEKNQLERQLIQAQKIEAVGQLAGGIAHDFNNILTAIVGYGNLLLMKLGNNDLLKQYAGQILAAADRGASLTRSLLAFSRKQAMNPEPVHLNEIIGQVQKLLERLIGEDIELITELSALHPVIMADSGQIEQILMNLVTNARDAMPEGGRISIRTDQVKIGAEYHALQVREKPGQYALLTVTDTGIGMDENMTEKIFEPFFTTKEVGKGTGLGLAMVYGIVQQHGGHIAVSSIKGSGTSFNIYLPVHEGSLKESLSTGPDALSTGTETILIAEDDEIIRELMRKVLEDSGYHVITAVDGDDAVARFLEHSTSIRLLILDLILPKRNGRDVFLHISTIKNDMKVLFTSGYTADILEQKKLLSGQSNFLPKPAHPALLLQRVREILDDQPAKG
jgi:PAS domain S-box-containing protein